MRKAKFTAGRLRTDAVLTFDSRIEMGLTDRLGLVSGRLKRWVSFTCSLSESLILDGVSNRAQIIPARGNPAEEARMIC